MLAQAKCAQWLAYRRHEALGGVLPVQQEDDEGN